MTDLQTEIDRWDQGLLPIQMESLIEAARKWVVIQKAITDEGPEPRYHRKIMKRHRKEWPTLWDALEDK